MSTKLARDGMERKAIKYSFALLAVGSRQYFIVVFGGGDLQCRRLSTTTITCMPTKIDYASNYDNNLPLFMPFITTILSRICRKANRVPRLLRPTTLEIIPEGRRLSMVLLSRSERS